MGAIEDIIEGTLVEHGIIPSRKERARRRVVPLGNESDDIAVIRSAIDAATKAAKETGEAEFTLHIEYK
jgi:hypothetical protein